jgi:glucose/arabinose dehydrogenase
MKLSYILAFLGIILLVNCSNINPPALWIFKKDLEELPLDKLKLPQGFKVDIYAQGVVNARSMELSPNGTLFVGTRSEGNVYALKDTNGDMKADQVYTIAQDLKLPNGVAFRDGDLYVAEVNRVIKFENIEEKLDNPPTPKIIFDQYPEETHHGWKFIAFGPDDKLYIPVGAPCNICESEDRIFNTITRINPDGSGFEIVHEGVRNTVGFTWHPETGDIWFTDNGRDWLGDDSPACELNHASKDGMHFGYPYCHQGDLADPEFGEKRPCSDFKAPARKLGPHVAPLGLEFYTANQFPEDYKGHLLIAEHGSWNRSKKSGYRIMQVKLDGNKAVSYEPFIEGWLEVEEDDAWGRPVDLEFLPDGSMLISDDYADVIYRVYYEG